jgi:ADP-ribose pyrophosphatase YjhB (NUDIX family)
LIRTLEPRRVYENAYVEVYDDRVIFPDGHEGTYYYSRWKAPYGVGIVAVADRSVLLVRSYRYAEQGYALQIPLGFGSAHRTPSEQAATELREETGLEATGFEPLVRVGGAYATHVFMARVDDPTAATAARQEATEDIIGFEWVPIAELTPAGLAARGVNEAITLASLLAARMTLGDDDLL